MFGRVQTLAFDQVQTQGQVDYFVPLSHITVDSLYFFFVSLFLIKGGECIDCPFFFLSVPIYY